MAVEQVVVAGSVGMKIGGERRSYQLTAGSRLRFMQKDGPTIVHDGTTNEEVLEVLIHRVTAAYQSVPCAESIRALYCMHEALLAFRLRATRRAIARVDGTDQAHGGNDVRATDAMAVVAPFTTKPFDARLR